MVLATAPVPTSSVLKMTMMRHFRAYASVATATEAELLVVLASLLLTV
jgi:hypothetical protein